MVPCSTFHKMEDRRLTRKEPLELEVPSLGTKITISPIRWRARGDLGNLIQEEFTKALDASKGEHAKVVYNQIDYGPIVSLGTGLTAEQVDQLTYPEIIGLCHWICDLNGLDTVLWMLDPEAPAPNLLMEEGAEVDGGEKTSSTDDSSSRESSPLT